MDGMDETTEMTEAVSDEFVSEPQKRITKKVIFAGLGIILLTVIVAVVLSYDELYDVGSGRGDSGASQTTGAASSGALMVGLDSETSCGGTGDIRAVVRNVGSETITVASLKFYLDGIEAAPTGCLGTIRPGAAVTCTISNPGKQGTIRLRVSGPTNDVETPVYCA